MTANTLDTWVQRPFSDDWKHQGLHWHLWTVEVALPRTDGNQVTPADRRRMAAQHVANDPAEAAAWLAERAAEADQRANAKWAGLSAWSQGYDWSREVIARGLSGGRLDPAVPGGSVGGATGPVWHVSSVRVSDQLAVEMWALDFTARECPGHS